MSMVTIIINQTNNLVIRSEEMSKEITIKKFKTTCLCPPQIFFSEYFATKFLKNYCKTHLFIGSHGFSAKENQSQQSEFACNLERSLESWKDQ